MAECRNNCPIINGGFCERHQQDKTSHWVMLCTTRDNYFRAWEDGRGPGQLRPGDRSAERPRVNRGGPGHEMTTLFSSLRVVAKMGCGCAAKARQMDRWGVAGCEEHFDEIVGWMREASKKWGWREKMQGAIRLATLDPVLAVRLNPVDPFPGLIREAIERARIKESS